MGLKPDHWIRKMAQEHRMIEPYADSQVRDGVISYGVSSYGYDIRVADEFKIFTNVYSAIVDPKNFDTKSMVDYKGEVCVIPPNSFALARTIEYFRIPRKVLTVCLGKCLTGVTRVVDAETGNYLPLKDFIAARSPSTVSLQDWRLGQKRVVDHVDNGLKPVYELTTRAGLRIKATANHPFRTLEGWRALTDLLPGERIAVARSCPVFGRSDFPEHEAVLLGLMLSDGQCHTPGHSPRFTNEDPALVEALADAAQKFGCEVSPVGKMGYNLVNRRKHGGRMSTNRVYRWLQDLGCNTGAADKHVPSAIFTARRGAVRKFLQALFSGDGSIYSSEKGVFLEYSTISERLVYDLHHLLLRFGIFGLVRSKTLATGGKAYRIQITDPEMIGRFGREIGFIPGSKKQAVLEELQDCGALNLRKRSNFDTLPPAAWGLRSDAKHHAMHDALHDVVHASGHSLRSIGIRGTYPDQSLPFATARQATQVVEAPEFAAFVEADVIWDVVASIEPAGVEQVYDLTIPETHNFLANDFIVHNSTYARCGIIVNVTPFEPCYSEDTEILTDQGWKLIRDVEVGARVLGMCPDGHADWQPVWKKQEYHYEGNLLHFEGRNIDLLVTPEHKLLVRKRIFQRKNTKGIYTNWHTIEASEVHGKYNFEMSRRVIWNGLDAGDQVSIGKGSFPTDAFLEFLGMYLGDGSCYLNKGGHLIKIAAFKQRELEVYESILQRLKVKYNRTKTGYQFFSKDFYDFLRPLGHANEKYIPHWVKELSPNYLERLLFGLMNSNGNLETATYTTTSRRLADDVQEVMFKAGCAAIVREAKQDQDREVDGHTIRQNHPVYKVRMCKTQLDPKTYPKTHKQVAYRGNVYDVTVPGHIVFVRRNGKAVWSGNCWEGYVTLEISNTTPLPAKIYANEGIAQVLFFEADEECEISYADKKGKYQKQQSIVLPKL